MNIIGEMLDELIKNIVVGAIRFALEGSIGKFNEELTVIGGDLTQTPSRWNEGIWNMVSGIAQDVVVPVAGLILTAVLCMELMGWVNEQNNMHNSGAVIGHLIKSFLKIAIGILVVEQAHQLTITVFDLGAQVAREATGYVHMGGAGGMELELDLICEELMKLDIGPLVGTMVASFLCWGGISIISMLVQVIVIGRMIEIYLYCSIGAIPYATLMNRELSSIGQNYIKNLFALAFQGLFILVAFGIYGILVTAIRPSNDPMQYLVEQLVTSGALLFSILQSKPMSKSIFGAH